MPRRDDAARPRPWGEDPAPAIRAALAGALVLVLGAALLSHGAVTPAPRAACVAALGALATATLFFGPRLLDGARLAVGPSGGAVAALLVLAAIGAAIAPYTHAALERLSVLAGAGAVYLITSLAGTTRGALRGLRLGALLLAGAAAADALADHLRGTPVSGGPFVNPNHLAALLAASLPLALAAEAIRCGEDRSPLASLVHLAIAGLCLAGLLVTRSRGGILASGVGLVATAVLILPRVIPARGERRRARRIFPAMAAAALLFAGLVLALGSAPGRSALARFRPAPDHSESSAGLRLSIWSSTLRAVAEGGPVGWGLGSFRFVYPAYRGADIPYGVSHAHNDWLEGTLELGWAFPALALGAGVIVGRRAAITARGRRTRLAAGTAAGAGAGLAALAVHAAVDFPLQVPFLIWFAALLAGLVSASARIPTPGRVVSARGIVLDAWPAAAVAAMAALIISAAGFREVRAGTAMRNADRAAEGLEARRAVSESRRAVGVDPGSAEAHAALARALVLSAAEGGGGKPSLRAAAASLERASTLNPRDTDMWIELARVREALGEPAAADGAYARAARLDPRSGMALEARADFLLRTGHREEALRVLRASAESDARALPRILTSLWGTTGKPALLRAATPGTVRDLVLLGDFLETKGRVPEARAAFEDAESIAPKDPLPAARKAALLLRRGSPEDALGAVRAAIGRGADSASLRISLAASLAATGNRVSAAREYERLVAEPEVRKQAVEALADLYARAGDRGRLVGLREKVARMSPGDPSARVALARAYRAAGRWPAAVETCRSVLADDPGMAACRYLLADLYAERGLAAAAEMTLQTRLSQSPGDIAALTRLARLYAAEGRHAEARSRYRRVLAIEPGNAEARAALARRAKPGRHGDRTGGDTT